jgi:hypothetical protein
LSRLLAGVREQPGGVELVDRYAPAAFSEEVHILLLTSPNFPVRISPWDF